jgi:protein O-mannosyl-transferase
VSRRAWLAGLGLAVLVLAAYLPALSAGFVWDDDRHVTANPALRGTQGLIAAWTTTDATPQYYPLTHTSFWLEHRIWGFDPRGYHATNIALHATSAILVWRILLLLELPGAWVAAALFAVHPVHAESVVWVSERKNVLSGVLYLAAARVFLGWALGAGSARRKPVIAFALYVGALLAKTVASTLPVALALILWWKRGRITRREAAWLVPMLLTGAVFGAITHHLERTQVGAFGPDWDLSLAARAALAGRVLWFYLGKLAWPGDLVFIYPRWAIDPSALAAWTWTIAALAVAAVLWFARDRLGRGPAAAAAFFAATLSPALGFFDVYPMRYSWVADHFQYLASLGPMALASAWLTLGPRGAAAAHPSWRRAAAAIAGAVVLLLAGRTFARCGAYADEETLWRDTLARNPDAWIAHNNLGIALAERGANDEAAAHFERVLALRPGHSGARANLGYLEELAGDDARAAATLARAAGERPDDGVVRVHLVRVLLRLGRPDEALEPALAAARLRPDDPDALCDAGTLLARAGRLAEAVPLLERAAAMAPSSTRARANLDRARRAAADVEYPRGPMSPTGENAK